MADKLTSIKIKQKNGSYTTQIPVSVSAQNVQWDGSHSLLDILGSVDINVGGKGNVQHQFDDLYQNIDAFTDDINSEMTDFTNSTNQSITDFTNTTNQSITDFTNTANQNFTDFTNATNQHLSDVLGNISTETKGTVQAQMDKLQNDMNTFHTQMAAEIGTDVSAWLQQNVTPAGSMTMVDNSLTISDAAADAKAVGDALTSLNGSLGDVKAELTYKTLSTYPQNAGSLGASTTWVNVNTATYKHIAVPVKSGDVITVTANMTSYTRIGLLKTYSVPTANTDVVDYSAQTGFTDRILVTAGTSYLFNVPSDATYLIILTLDGGDNAFPSSCVINGLDYCKGLGTVVQGINADVDKKSAWDDLGVKAIGSYAITNGLINSSGKWGSITSAYKHVAIPVKNGDVIDIEGSANRSTYIGFLKSYDMPVNGESADFSAQTGFTARILIAVNTVVSYTVPSDAKYLYYLILNDNIDALPVSLKINGYDITHRLDATIAGIKQEIENNKYTLFNRLDYAPAWESGTFTSTVGSASSNQAEVTRQRMVKYGKNPIQTILHTDGTFITNLVLYNDDMTVNRKTNYTKADKVIPANTIYRILLADGVSNTTDISSYTSGQINTHITVLNTQFYDLINPAVNWCAMGDSITEGFVSYLDDGEPTYKIDKDLAWAYKVAKKNNWNLTNLGIGGTGWNKATNAEVEQGIDTTSAHYIAEHTDFTPFNLVTLSYGINDWKANYQTGTIDGDYITPTTTIGGMRATIDAIMASNPHCKIIVILPLNCAGYSFNYGDESTNWSLGYSFSNSGTLEQFTQALISVCDYYGIQYIDMAHYSCVNRKNLLNCLTDGVHPNAETHDLLARELARKITFN